MIEFQNGEKFLEQLINLRKCQLVQYSWKVSNRLVTNNVIPKEIMIYHFNITESATQYLYISNTIYHLYSF